MPVVAAPMAALPTFPNVLNHPGMPPMGLPANAKPASWPVGAMRPQLFPMGLAPPPFAEAPHGVVPEPHLLAAMASLQQQACSAPAPAALERPASGGEDDSDESQDPSQPGKKSTDQSMKEAAEMLSNAALALKRRRCLVAVDEVPGFVRTVYTLLTVCDSKIISWSEDGTKIVIKSPDRFAREVCPKFFRHRNFNSFTRLLNMYQFHKVPSNRRESKEVCFAHPHFQRGREDMLPLVQRKGAQLMREELMARELLEQSALGAVAALETALHPLHPTLVPPGHKQQDMAAACAAAAAASADPSSWMQRMADLEKEVNHLKEENDRLKKLEAERDRLRADLRAQGELITALHAQSTILGALNSLASSTMPSKSMNEGASSSSSTTASDDESKSKDDENDPANSSTASDVTPPDVPDLNNLLQQMGGASAVAVILSMFGNAHNQVLPTDELPPFSVAENGLDPGEVTAPEAPCAVEEGPAKKKRKSS